MSAHGTSATNGFRLSPASGSLRDMLLDHNAWSGSPCFAPSWHFLPRLRQPTFNEREICSRLIERHEAEPRLRKYWRPL